ncbi:hypothetical protein AWZ03_015476, partial [Drosophila navojoa]
VTSSADPSASLIRDSTWQRSPLIVRWRTQSSMIKLRPPTSRRSSTLQYVIGAALFPWRAPLAVSRAALFATLLRIPTSLSTVSAE